MVRPSYRVNLAGNTDGSRVLRVHLRPGAARARPTRSTCAAARGRRAASSAGRRSSTSAATRPSRPAEQAHRHQDLHAAVPPAAGRHRQRRPADLAAAAQPAAPPHLGHPVRPGASPRRCASRPVLAERLPGAAQLRRGPGEQHPALVLHPQGGRASSRTASARPGRRPHRRRGLHRPAADSTRTDSSVQQPSFRPTLPSAQAGHVQDDRPAALRPGRPGQPRPVTLLQLCWVGGDDMPLTPLRLQASGRGPGIAARGRTR